MQTLKGIVTDKNFWIGCAVGFAFGAMHHYFGLSPKITACTDGACADL